MPKKTKKIVDDDEDDRNSAMDVDDVDDVDGKGCIPLCNSLAVIRVLLFDCRYGR